MQRLNIDTNTLVEFRKFVLEKHGIMRGVLHQEAEQALRNHIAAHRKESEVKNDRS